jgi:hypothetical protein
VGRMGCNTADQASCFYSAADSPPKLFHNKTMCCVCACTRSLRDTADAGHELGVHPEQLHAALLRQLESVPEVAGLTPQQLLSELQALQLFALYGGEWEAEPGHDSGAADGGLGGTGDAEGRGAAAAAGCSSAKCKLGGLQLDEFLVEQVRVGLEDMSYLLIWTREDYLHMVPDLLG